MTKGVEKLTEATGWIGVVCIMVAYALLSADVLTQDHAAYHVLNLLGGTGIAIDAFADHNYQPVILNIVWIAIAVYAITRIII